MARVLSGHMESCELLDADGLPYADEGVAAGGFQDSASRADLGHKNTWRWKLPPWRKTRNDSATTRSKLET